MCGGGGGFCVQGGSVRFNGGTERVEGRLAVARAIGDHALGPYVIPEPTVCSLPLPPDALMLMLCSDGRVAALSRRPQPPPSAAALRLRLPCASDAASAAALRRAIDEASGAHKAKATKVSAS